MVKKPAQTQKEVLYKVSDEGGRKLLKIDYSKSITPPNIDTSAISMARLINKLMEVGMVNEVSFMQKEEYVYDESQVAMLYEIADLIKDLVERKNILDFQHIRANTCQKPHPERRDFLRTMVMYQLREDPIGAFISLSNKLNELQRSPPSTDTQGCPEVYFKTLDYIYNKLANSRMIKLATPYKNEYSPTDRQIYGRLFRPIILPNFLYTRVVTSYPAGAEELEVYEADGTDIMILRLKDEIRPLYHVTPPEFKLTESKYDILGEAKQVVAEHKPQKSEYLEPERTREVFMSVEKDLLRDLARSKGLNLSYQEIESLAQILIRHTIGFGILEVLLSDSKIQDISINSPIGKNAITIIHADYGECITNISITENEAQSWATKLRLISGRPFDEANPVLDTNLVLPVANARVAAIQEPLSPNGLAYSIRRHRDKPWTLPLFIKNKMIDELAAGLLEFLVDGSRTMLIAGTRSSGKTSFLSALLVEIMRSSRIITVEDTLELPIKNLKDLNYDVQSLKVQSVITQGGNELGAAEGIRTALRLGDSALIIGEVRSKEALALYEAMRVGALANVVAGTIHGDSPYGVYDRVVNDLGVPATSFKATDIIIVANPVKSASGLRRERRIVQIAEVRKEWTKDPQAEHGFVDLMTYNPKTDKLEPTDSLVQGESEVIKKIAASIKEWAGDWDAVWENIQLRAKTKKYMVDKSDELKRPEILEAEWVVRANDEFHRISQRIEDEVGKSDSTRIYAEWEKWFNSELRRQFSGETKIKFKENNEETKESKEGEVSGENSGSTESK